MRKATVTKKSGEFYTLRFEDGGGIRLRENRLYATQEAAEGNIPQRESEKQEKGNFDGILFVDFRIYFSAFGILSVNILSACEKAG